MPNGGTDPPFLVQKIDIGTQQATPVYGDDQRNWVEDWSADGRFLLTHDTKTVSMIPLSGDHKPTPLYGSDFIKDAFHLSPDGQLIAYGDSRTGRWEVFVASFPSFRDVRQVSVAGGAQPRWRGDGRELFFLDLNGSMMSVTVERGAPAKLGTPRKLFDTRLEPDPTVNQYAVTKDGLKFLVLEPRKGFNETYSVVLNWPETLR
jgi:Tol biopolymer transport system component